MLVVPSSLVSRINRVGSGSYSGIGLTHGRRDWAGAMWEADDERLFGNYFSVD